MRKKIGIIFSFFLLWFLFQGNHPLFSQKIITQVDAACQNLGKGEIDKAIELLEKELKTSPNNFNAHLYLGIAFYLKKDLERAFGKFAKIEKEISKRAGFDRPETPAWSIDGFDPAHVDPKLLESWMDRKSDFFFSKEKIGLLFFFRGLSLKEKKDFKRAEQKFKKALKFKYDEMTIREQLFNLYIKKKNLKAASKQLAELRKISGESELLIFLDGYLKYRNDSLEGAMADFEKVASTFLEAKENIARLHYNNGNYQKAIEVWEEILSQNADDKGALINLGRAYFHLGDSDKAQEYFSTAGLKISPARYSPKKMALVYEIQLEEIEFDLKCK